MYITDTVRLSRRKHEKPRPLRNVSLPPCLKLLFVGFVSCVAVSYTLHVFRARLQEIKFYEILQGKSLTACTKNTQDLRSRFNSSLEYQCDLFCKTLERETRRLKKEAESLNKKFMVQDNELTRKISQILIVSYKRSGSSFFGEIFNRHRDIFYLYEPLHSLSIVGKEGTAIYFSMVKHLLGVILSCRFAEHPYYVGYSNYGDFRARSRVLSQGCITGWRPEKTLVCENIDPKTMTALCESHQHVALKTIRIRNFDTLKSVINSTKTTRILHLVRDPRAVINSRRKLNAIESSEHESDGSLRESARELCQEMLKKLKQGATMKRWTGRYHVIRYEDVAERPIPAVKELYNYVGVNPSQDVFDWISKNTNAAKETDSFSTTKNATISANKWKVDLDLNTIRLIEQECREVMQVLGYKLIDNTLAKNGTGINTKETTIDINRGQGLFVTKAVEDTVLKYRAY